VHPASRSLIGRWIYAAKIGSWPKLLVPALFGQGLGVAAAGRLDTLAVGLGLASTLSLLLSVVLLNDWGDRRVDRIKRQMFPDGCSAKTVPDEILPASAVLAAGLVSAASFVGVGFYAQLELGRAPLGWASLAMLALFLSYTFPPLRLNYRGGGEWLEGLGVGLILPLFHMAMQADLGLLWSRGLWLLPGHLLLALASAVASGLADEQSDRRGGKRTYVSEYGNQAGRALVERLSLAAALVWAVGIRIGAVIPAPVGAIVVVIVLVNWRRMRQVSPEAKTNAFGPQREYKRLLHQGQWRAAALVALALVLWTLVWGGSW